MDLLVDDIDFLLTKKSPLSEEDVTKMLELIAKIVKTGRDMVVRKALDGVEALKKARSVDWKKHLETMKEILEIVGELPAKEMKPKKDTLDTYDKFVRDFLALLKKIKLLPQLQSSLVTFFFNCLQISTPAKAEFAEKCSDRRYMDLSKEPSQRQVTLENLEQLLQSRHMPKGHRDVNWALGQIIDRLVESYENNGKAVTEKENELFMAIFKLVSEGKETVEEQFYCKDDTNIPNLNFRIWRDGLRNYINLHQKTGTLACITPIVPRIFHWIKIAVEEDHDDMINWNFGMLQWIGLSPPTDLKDTLPEIIDLMLEAEKFQELQNFVSQLYPHNPKAVHDRLQDLFDAMEDMNANTRVQVMGLFHQVSQKSPGVFTKQQISGFFERYKSGTQHEQMNSMMIIRAISEKHPKNLVDFLPQLCDDTLFTPDSLNLRTGIIACVGGLSEKLGEKAVDYLMKYADYSDSMISQIVVGQLSTMVRKHTNYMQKYKSKLENLEQTATVPGIKDLAHNMILILEGKSVENIVEDIQQQQEDIADLDEKVDATIDTVVTIGDKVIEHDKEIGELGEGLERVEERLDDVEEDLGETKIKVEEIDNKTMSNAPKWSRDLTKLMNPVAENDWRLLASRLGYSNDDIRSWATQHDPCMALLSEWYATHKTSEASYGVLTALTEMNRMDGVAIVENAMKAAEGVVEDEEFEYPSPPPVFISYQWGFQNEVKLLKQHLNMAGYECWLDVGQMGGGDKLFAKIDNGIRGAKIVICCVTEKYAQSPNCNREVNLSVNLNKPIIPLLMEKMDWPPKGSMGPIFSEYLFIRFFQRGGEETKEKDQRYWPIPKFQELLMQLNFFVVPDQKMVKKEYTNWWAPMTEDIVIDKNKGKKQATIEKPTQKNNQVVKADKSPLVFLSYQWGKQPQVRALYQRLTSMGYTVWMDIYQMGGGDSLYDKIDRGMRGCKAVVSCVTQKYSLSANCRREVSLADALKKPIIPLLLEQMKWPPDGPMSMVFTELLFINFYRDEAMQMTWKGEKFDELQVKLNEFVPEVTVSSQRKEANGSSDLPGKTASGSKNGIATAFDSAVSMEGGKSSSNSAGEQKAQADIKTRQNKQKGDNNSNNNASKSEKAPVEKTVGDSTDKNIIPKASAPNRGRAVTKAASVKALSNTTEKNKTDHKQTTNNAHKADNSSTTVKTAADERNLGNKANTEASTNQNMSNNHKDKRNSVNVNSTTNHEYVETKEEKSEAGHNQKQINTANNESKSKSCIIL